MTSRPALDAFLTRFRFEERRKTLFLIALILVWYFLQIGVVFLGISIEEARWWFTTESFPRLSPGLVLASISHSFTSGLHLASNILFLWLFAGESEQHMSRLEFFAFFMVIGIISVNAGTAITGENSAGASGAAFAFLGFYTIHMTLTHREQMIFDTSGLDPLGFPALKAYYHMSLVLFPLAATVFLLLQLFGVVDPGKSDVYGHLAGLWLGIIYAAYQQIS